MDHIHRGRSARKGHTRIEGVQGRAPWRWSRGDHGVSRSKPWTWRLPCWDPLCQRSGLRQGSVWRAHGPNTLHGPPRPIDMRGYSFVNSRTRISLAISSSRPRSAGPEVPQRGAHAETVMPWERGHMLASHRGKAPPRCTCIPPAPSTHSGRVAGAAGTALGGMMSWIASLEARVSMRPLGTWQSSATRPPPGHRSSTCCRLCTPAASRRDPSRRWPLLASRTALSWLIPRPGVTRPGAAHASGVACCGSPHLGPAQAGAEALHPPPAAPHSPRRSAARWRARGCPTCPSHSCGAPSHVQGVKLNHMIFAREDRRVMR